MSEFFWPTGWTPQARAKLQQSLLSWFDAHQRPLPWRQNRDPYAIWISEVMLQQTTVAAVGSYFARFLQRFPNLQALAEAPAEEVLKLWEGLGYYRRARHLHEAAGLLWRNHGDSWPDDPAVWTELPGIGPYMLGAVLSQAFDRKLPIVEANTLRVLSRWFAFRSDPREGPGKKWVWAAAEAVLPDQRVGDFNQAMMELGATVCKIEQPNCLECSVEKWCESRKLGLQAEIPVPPRAKKIEQVQELALIIQRAGAILLVKRSASAKRWANMWEVPHQERTAERDFSEQAEQMALEKLGLKIRVGEERLRITHGVTRFQITMTCLDAEWLSGEFTLMDYVEGRWVSPSDFGNYAMSSPQRKLLSEVSRTSQRRRLF